MLGFFNALVMKLFIFIFNKYENSDCKNKFQKLIHVIRGRGGGGAGRAKALPHFGLGSFLRAPKTWIFMNFTT